MTYASVNSFSARFVTGLGQAFEGIILGRGVSFWAGEGDGHGGTGHGHEGTRAFWGIKGAGSAGREGARQRREAPRCVCSIVIAANMCNKHSCSTLWGIIWCEKY